MLSIFCFYFKIFIITPGSDFKWKKKQSEEKLEKS